MYTYNCGNITEKDRAYIAPFALGWEPDHDDVMGLPSHFWLSVRGPFSEFPVIELLAVEPVGASRQGVWHDHVELALAYVRGHVGINADILFVYYQPEHFASAEPTNGVLADVKQSISGLHESIAEEKPEHAKTADRDALIRQVFKQGELLRIRAIRFGC